MAAMMLATGLLGVTPAQAAAGDGSAYGLKVDAGPTTLVGPLAHSTTDGPSQNAVGPIMVPGIVSAGAMETSATHDPVTGTVTSRAQTSDIQTFGLGIEAARAECTATSEGVSGSAELAGLDVPGGLTIPADAPPNSSFDFAGGRVTVNEQINNPDGGLTVSAAHLRMPAPDPLPAVDIVIASATCGPATSSG